MQILSKAAPPFDSSNNELHSCRLSIAEKHGANNQQEQSKAPLTVRYEIHTSAQPIQQRNLRSKSDNRSMGTSKAPSCHISHKSSTALWLFQQWTALLQTINCRKAWGKQPTGTEQGSPHCWVWNSHKSQARIKQPICRTNHVAQQFSCLLLDNGTEKWRKVVLDNLWKSHINWHSLASIRSVGSRRLLPQQPFAIWR
jgi:hypothetical protein